jgi:3-deoxy-D-manno-octulosonic acid (KDO) 8-phosphate synthase
MKVRLPYYGTKCKPTELFLAINRTSSSVIIKKTCMLINVAVPGDRNVIENEAGKILKYKDIIIDIQHVWNVKAKVIPVIIGATGTISKSFIQYSRKA